MDVTYKEGGYDPNEPFDNVLYLWDDDALTFHDYSDGTDVDRPYDAFETARAVARRDAVTAATNESTLRDQALAALQTNRDFLALATPTNVQAIAQIRALSRQNNALIRLVGRFLDGVD